MMKISVMSFNLRVDCTKDGINRVCNRRGRILETIKTYSPDIIGFQEADDEIREWLRDSLSDYVVVGCGREADFKGESVPIAFRKDMFEMISCENFALSLTPEIMGTRFEGVGQSDNARMATAIKLKPNGEIEPFLFMNTHADHHAAEARALEFSLLVEYMSKKGDRCILTGDLNTLPDEQILQIFSENPHLPLKDATSLIDATFHAFGQIGKNEFWKKRYGTDKVKIDYIFTTLPTDPETSFAVEDIPVDGIYISDHRPVVAYIEI
ncbi:MAG: endonuclease/exonuclease/phosphatase family protein [Clostridia bacterium]|nr:endonuclease/exonuclease/phosphatase family protein [Clostridia bacterium]